MLICVYKDTDWALSPIRHMLVSTRKKVPPFHLWLLSHWAVIFVVHAFYSWVGLLIMFLTFHSYTMHHYFSLFF